MPVSLMDIVVNGYGASLRKKGNRFALEHGGEVQEFSADMVRQFILSDSVSITSGAMKLAAEKGIDIVVLSRSGMPVCRVYPCEPCGTVTTRKNQLAAASTAAGYHLSAAMVSAKVTNMANLLAALGKSRNNHDLRSAAEEIGRLADAIPPEGTPSMQGALIRGIEGRASRVYFAALSLVIPPDLYRGRRSQHPAEDVFNAYLNYCYGILYNEVEKACILAGLDPYIGFLHAERYGKRSFVYDVIEQFRQPVVDRMVITLAVRGRMQREDTDERWYLVGEGRRKAIASTLQRLDEERVIGGRTTSFRSAVLENARSIVNYLNEGAVFEPFVYRWG